MAINLLRVIKKIEFNKFALAREATGGSQGPSKIDHCGINFATEFTMLQAASGYDADNNMYF